MTDQENNQDKTAIFKSQILSLLALFSGCCALAYEVLYVRSLTAILGDMFYVHAALLSTFLVGIGLGSKWAYKALRWLWLFEILTGLYAFALPLITRWLSEQPVMVPITASATLTVLATIAFISAPGLLIGFSIPLFSAYIKKYTPQQLCFQWVYCIYNLGAAISVLAVEFFLIRLFGISDSLAIVGVINIFNGVVLLLLSVKPEDIKIEQPFPFPKRYTVALAMGSLASAIFQMHFLKLSYLVFYPYRENFAIDLAVTMLGIFLGAWLASKIKIRFQTCLLLAAALIAFIYISYMPIIHLYDATVGWTRSAEFLVIAHKFIFICFFALGPMILFGALIPVLMRSETSRAKEVAEESGHLLWVSSLANAAGYLVYVFIGHPLMSTGVMLALLSALLIAAALIAGRFRLAKVEKIAVPASLVLAIVLVLVWQDRNFYLAHWATQLKPADKVTVYKSDAESAVLVETDRNFKILNEPYEYVWQDNWITYNGHPSITVERNGIVNSAEIAVGVIPALDAPSLERALVIGLGTGVTAGATSQIFKSTDVVEINRAFYQMLPALSYDNADIADNPKATLYVTDGRAFLVGRDKQYDLIVSTVSAPTDFSASKIYTIDFYSRVKKALKDGGVFAVWISAGDMSHAGMFTILSALRHNFDYCSVSLLRGYYYLLTCSNKPIEQKRLFSQLPSHNVLAQRLYAALPFMNLDYYFQDIMLTKNIFQHFDPNVPQENTDDHPVLEFMVVRDYQLGRMGNDPFVHQQDLFNIDPVKKEQTSDVARFAHRAFVIWRLGMSYFDDFQHTLTTDPNVASQFFLLSGQWNLHENKLNDAVKQLAVAAKIKPGFAAALNNLGQAYLALGDKQKAVDNFTKALNAQPDYADAHNNLAEILATQGQTDQAIDHLKKAIQYQPAYLKAYINLGKVYVQLHQFDKASEILKQGLDKAGDTNSEAAEMHLVLGMVYQESGQAASAKEHLRKAVEGFRKELESNHGLTDLWSQLADAYNALKEFDLAADCYRKAIKRNPQELTAHIKFALLLNETGKTQQALSVLQNAIEYFSGSRNPEAVKIIDGYLQQIRNTRNQPQ